MPMESTGNWLLLIIYYYALFLLVSIFTELRTFLVKNFIGRNVNIYNGWMACFLEYRVLLFVYITFVHQHHWKALPGYIPEGIKYLSAFKKNNSKINFKKWKQSKQQEMFRLFHSDDFNPLVWFLFKIPSIITTKEQKLKYNNYVILTRWKIIEKYRKIPIVWNRSTCKLIFVYSIHWSV